MTSRERIAAWTVFALALVGLLVLLGGVLTPFALGAVAAYLLDPVCGRLTRAGLGRGLASLLLIVAVVALALGALLTVAPLLIEQVAEAVARLPQAVDALRRWIHLHLGTGGGDELMQRLAETLRERAGGLSGEALANAWAGGKAIVSFAGVLAVTPVVAFYLLLDWPRLVAAIDSLVPPARRATVRAVALEIDSVLSALLRGLGTVCLSLGVFYAVGLSLIGLEFGLLIGLFSGAISFIPYVGATIGGALSLGVALYQFWGSPEWIAAVAAVYVAGQTIEGNVLTPALVGSAVQAHPLWLLFALGAFGVLFGFVGLLAAVPATAVIGVLVRRGVTLYRESPLYRAEDDP